MQNTDALKKAAAIAKIHLTEKEMHVLLGEIDEILQAFSKIDSFNEAVGDKAFIDNRKLRKDVSKKSDIDPFGNTKLIKNGKFLGPRLVD